MRCYFGYRLVWPQLRQLWFVIWGASLQVTAVPREGITLAWHGSDIVGSHQGCRSLRIGGLLIDLSRAFFSRT